MTRFASRAVRAMWPLVALAATAFGQFNKDMSLLEIDPLNRNVVWATNRIPFPRPAVVKSYLYRSPDQGGTWQALRFPGGLPEVVSFAVDQGQSGTVYVLTADAAGRFYRSTDSGATWTNLTSRLPAGFVPTLVQSFPGNPSLVFLQGLNQGTTKLVKSVNRAESFEAPVTTPCTDVVEINYRSPRRQFCRSLALLRTSNDEGVTWSAGVNLRLPDNIPITQISFCQNYSSGQQPDTVMTFCFLFGADSNSVSGQSQRDVFYRSTDGLASFNIVSLPVGLPGISATRDRSMLYIRGSGSPIRTTNLAANWDIISPVNYPLLADPVNPLTVFDGPTRKSTNGAGAFTTITPKFMPAFSALEGTNLTLEEGTAFEVSSLAMKDQEGDSYSLAATDPIATGGASAFKQVPRANALPRVLVSAANLKPGNFELSVALRLGDTNVARLPIHLTVTGPAAARLRFMAREMGTTSSDGGQSAVACCVPNMTVRGDGSLLIAETRKIRSIAADGKIAPFAGTGDDASTGNGGSASQAGFRWVVAMVTTPDGVVVADGLASNLRLIRHDTTVENFYNGSSAPSVSSQVRLGLDQTGAVVLLNPFDAVYRSRGNGQWEKVATVAQLLPPGQVSDRPTAFAVDRFRGDYYFAFTNAIMRRTSSGVISLFAGQPGFSWFDGDHGPATDAKLTSVTGMALDNTGNLFLVDGNRLRVIYRDGVIQTVAGSGDITPAPSALSEAATASLDTLYAGLTTDSSNRVYLSNGAHVYRLEPQAAAPAPTPRISTGGVVSLASGRSGLAPGAIFSIYGVDLASRTAGNTSVPLPLLLSGVAVEINGQRAPLFFVSTGQINAQVPYEIAPGTVRVRVLRDGVPSAEVTATVVTAAPDILQYGDRRAIAVNQNGELNGPDSPAEAGSVVVLYLTGIGAVTPAAVTGAPPGELSRAHQKATLTIAGREIALLFLGLAPGFVGLGQANFELPADLPAGDHEFFLTVAGSASNSVRLAVVSH